MRRAAIAVVLVVLVVGSPGVAYIAGSSQKKTTQNTTVTSSRFELAFTQVPTCPKLGFIAPWSVALSDGEKVTALNESSPQCCGSSPTNPSTITFLVPDGNYSFSVQPSSRFMPSDGTVVVDDQAVVVSLGQVVFSCGSTSTA